MSSHQVESITSENRGQKSKGGGNTEHMQVVEYRRYNHIAPSFSECEKMQLFPIFEPQMAQTLSLCLQWV